MEGCFLPLPRPSVFIKTRIARRQRNSNRDFKKKRKGAVQSQACHPALSTGFYGNRMGFVQNFPLPPLWAGPVPASQALYLCGQLFLLSHSLPLLLTIPSNNTHHHRHQKKRELTASGPNYVTIQRYPGNWQPADCPGEPHPSLCSLSCLISYSLPP